MTQAKRSTQTKTITRAQRFQIVAESMCDERSVAAVYNGSPVRSVTHERIAVAAKRLKLPPPPPRAK